MSSFRDASQMQIACRSLEIATWNFKSAISLANLELSCEEVLRDTAKQLVLTLQARIAREKVSYPTISYPANWWEALKDRFLPRWARKYVKVKYTEVRISAEVFYPMLSLPPGQAKFMDVYHLEDFAEY